MTELEQAQAEILSVFYGFDEEQYRNNEAMLSEILRRCRKDRNYSGALFVDRLIEQDRQLCGAKDVASNEVFRLFYRAGLPPAVIARKTQVGTRAVFKYIAITQKRMMVHSFGIDGLWRYVPRTITEQEWEQMSNRERGYHLYWLGCRKAEIADMLGVAHSTVEGWTVGWKTGQVASMRNNSKET